MREYDFMECCASGSCEVCRGAQGIVRQAVRREDQRAVECGCGDEYGHCVEFQMGHHFAPDGAS